MPLLPKLSFGIVDVRDVARAHIRVLEATSDAINGHRFILCSESKWLSEMAVVMDKTFRPLGYSIPLHEVSSLLISKYILD
jgi:hypothetical protein